MASINTSKARVTASIGAIQTLLEKYNLLFNIDSTVPGQTSFSFMINILGILGVNEADLIRWLAKILAGKGTDGVLYAIEMSIKSVLLANIRNLITCSINPLIPDKLMYHHKNEYGQWVGGEGVMINLDAVDLYGILENCPTSRDGGVFYFDARNSIYRDTDAQQDPSNDGYNIVDGYTINELWKSCDFNAYLWYVINKGSIAESEIGKLYWDNRVKYIETFKHNPDAKNNFFSGQCDLAKYVDIGVSGVRKKQYLICQYEERSESTVAPNVLRVWLNNYRYYQQTNVLEQIVKFNKTVIEFNWDYVMSLKLFDSKTLVASIIHAVLGILNTINPTYTIKKEFAAAQIRQIVGNIMSTDDMEVDDCYFSFSNDEYDSMLLDALRKKSGIYNGATINTDAIVDDINEIDNAATLHQQEESIANVLINIGNAFGANNNGINTATGYTTDKVERPGEITETDRFDWGLDIIERLLNETTTQIVMQVLGPKVAILYQINQYVMGDIDPESEIWKSNWSDLSKNFRNIIVAAVKEIKEIILQQMMAYVMKELGPLLKLFMSKLLLETLNNYVRLLKQLLRFCGTGNGGGLGSGTGYSGIGSVYSIDNVDYADIIPTKTQPDSSGKNNPC